MGGVASDKLYGDNAGCVHTGFHNLIHTCSDKVSHVTPAQVSFEHLVDRFCYASALTGLIPCSMTAPCLYVCHRACSA
jgi:hypothetical protein